MLYKDLFTPKRGVFTTIFQEHYENDYNTIFNGVSAETIDTYAYLNYGDKRLNAKITQDNHIDFIQSIISINIDNWINVVNVFNTEYNPLEPLIYRETLTENKQLDETDNKDVLQAEKTFNDNTFDNDRQEKNDSTRERQERNDYQSSRVGLNNLLHPTEAIQKEINLKRDNLKKNIIFELINQITIKIY